MPAKRPRAPRTRDQVVGFQTLSADGKQRMIAELARVAGDAGARLTKVETSVADLLADVAALDAAEIADHTHEQSEIDGLEAAISGFVADIAALETSVTALDTAVAAKLDAANVSGTSGTLAKFTAADAIGDSLLTESGTEVTVGGDLTVQSAGTATLTIEADTDNDNSGHNPILRLSQDGGATVATVMLDSGNDLRISAPDGIHFRPTGAVFNAVAMTSAGTTVTGNFSASGGVSLSTGGGATTVHGTLGVTSTATFSGTATFNGKVNVGNATTDVIEINGVLDHDGPDVGFYGATPVSQQSITSLTDNTGGTADDTIAAIADPADTPADADALRDDLVANALPAIRNAVADLSAKVNEIIDALAAVGLIS